MREKKILWHEEANKRSRGSRIVGEGMEGKVKTCSKMMKKSSLILRRWRVPEKAVARYGEGHYREKSLA